MKEKKHTHTNKERYDVFEMVMACTWQLPVHEWRAHGGKGLMSWADTRPGALPIIEALPIFGYTFPFGNCFIIISLYFGIPYPFSLLYPSSNCSLNTPSSFPYENCLIFSFFFFSFGPSSLTICVRNLRYFCLCFSVTTVLCN